MQEDAVKIISSSRLVAVANLICLKAQKGHMCNQMATETSMQM
jgi:hypothetical protein